VANPPTSLLSLSVPLPSHYFVPTLITFSLSTPLPFLDLSLTPGGQGYHPLEYIVPVNLPAPFEDMLIPFLLQHCLMLLVLTLTIVVLVVALLLRPL